MVELEWRDRVTLGAHCSGASGRYTIKLAVLAVPPGGVNGTAVTVNITYGLRDWSGNWDDQYDGTIFFSVIGE